MAKEAKSNKPGFWAGIKTEFGKVIWPEPASVGKQSVAVIAVSVVTAVLIVFIDMFVQYGVDFLVKM